jgi:hypothetical protein
LSSPPSSARLALGSPALGSPALVGSRALVGLTTARISGLARAVRPARILAWAGLCALLPATALTALGATYALSGGDLRSEEPTPPWVAFTMFGLHPLAVLGVALLLAAGILTLLSPVGAR